MAIRILFHGINTCLNELIVPNELWSNNITINDTGIPYKSDFKPKNKLSKYSILLKPLGVKPILLNIENSSNIDRLENSSSSQFGVNLESFTYKDVHDAVEPLVKDFIHNLFNFKIINLTKNSIEILAITSDCKLFQYTIQVSSIYSNFINRYISAILPYEYFIEMKRNLKNLDFSAALKKTLPIYNSKKEKLDTCGFLTFLLNTYKKDIKGEGSGSEGLKNFHKFFFDTCTNENEAMSMIRSCYTQAKTYEQKKQLLSNEEKTT